ncbi:hypothetical protein DKX38_013601 [Salix brachista]|uniref:Endonuclease/exonuclease/phosphatase domain-containing protein n=1 Tax=Salix brachista TaxID=2182728 RepID=A0A5N5LDA0_9ROSI|nr:hypothetical protein DKX38_013601 [Salix brachista]
MHTNPLCRIMVGWNTQKLHLQSTQVTDQWITCQISNHPSLSGSRFTFVYGSNSAREREMLWHYLRQASEDHKNIPWAILGDFNAVLRPSDRSGGSRAWHKHHDDFPECIMDSSLHQIPANGLHLTWHNGQSGQGTIMKKLDWIFSNLAILIAWPTARANFLPRQESDHSAMILTLKVNPAKAPVSFKFLNQWMEHEDFLDIVKSAWQHRIIGNPIYHLTSKLAILKQ